MAAIDRDSGFDGQLKLAAVPQGAPLDYAKRRKETPALLILDGTGVSDRLPLDNLPPQPTELDRSGDMDTRNSQQRHIGRSV